MDNPDIQKILESMESYPHTGRPRVVEDVRAADVAEALVDLDERARARVFSLRGGDQAAEVLAESDDNTQEALLATLGDRVARLLGVAIGLMESPGVE